MGVELAGLARGSDVGVRERMGSSGVLREEDPVWGGIMGTSLWVLSLRCQAVQRESAAQVNAWPFRYHQHVAGI